MIDSAQTGAAAVGTGAAVEGALALLAATICERVCGTARGSLESQERRAHRVGAPAATHEAPGGHGAASAALEPAPT